MSSITFLYPRLLWLLLLLPLMVGFYVLYQRHRYATLTLPSLYRLRGGGFRVYFRHMPFVLEMLALGALIVALARPRDSSHINERMIEGIDIIMAIDASGSMRAMDLEPNRFEAAKEVASQFIARRPNDNIGLVLFAGESFTRSPLTTDHATLLNLLESFQLGVLEDGTAIGMGLASACNRLQKSKTKSQIILLLTDGTNNMGSITPQMAASIAASLGIRIYTVAVGSYGEAPYPIETPFGTVVERVKVEIDEQTLKEIAETTGGLYFRATDKERLEAVYQEIDQLEKSKLITRSFQAYHELYYTWAMIALLFLVLAIVLRSSYCRTNP